MTNLCNEPALIPADHSRAALGPLADACSLSDGHSGDHSNSLAVWAAEPPETLSVAESNLRFAQEARCQSDIGTAELKVVLRMVSQSLSDILRMVSAGVPA